MTDTDLDFLVSYWAQITVILGFLITPITYMIKRKFDQIDKKYEVRHSLFQEQKITAINRFLSCYTRTELLFIQLPYYDIVNARKMDAKTLDSLIIPTYNDLLASKYQLIILLSDVEISDFDKIVKSIDNVKKMISKLRYEMTDMECNKADEYYCCVRHAIDTNQLLIKSIGKRFRQNYE